MSLSFAYANLYYAVQQPDKERLKYALCVCKGESSCRYSHSSIKLLECYVEHCKDMVKQEHSVADEAVFQKDMAKLREM